MASLEFATCDDSDEWDALVHASPHGSIFCESRFLATLRATPLLVGVYQGGNLLLGALVMLHRAAVLPAPSPHALYQGVLMSDRLASLPTRRKTNVLRATSFLLTELEQRFDRISFALHPQFRDIRSFNWFHYHEPDEGRFAVAVDCTGIVDLSPYGDLIDYVRDVRHDRRQEYNRALTQGFRVHASDDVSKLIDLYTQTLGRHRIRVGAAEIAHLRALGDGALRLGIGRLWACTDPAGDTVAMVLYLYDRHSAYNVVTGNHPGFRSTGASTLLLLVSMWHCRSELGVKFIDFVGMNSPNRSDYKTSLVADAVPYYVVSWERPTASHPRLPAGWR
jgi:Acetyltransferase (GNAT) domain